MTYDEWLATLLPFEAKALTRREIFQAGAASRDAEVARLEQENDQLRAQINMLREALEYCVTQVGELATVPGIASALSSTPEQSLAEYRNKVIEDCAITIENCEPDEHGRLSIQEIAEAVSAMKEQP